MILDQIPTIIQNNQSAIIILAFILGVGIVMLFWKAMWFLFQKLKKFFKSYNQGDNHLIVGNSTIPNFSDTNHPDTNIDTTQIADQPQENKFPTSLEKVTPLPSQDPVEDPKFTKMMEKLNEKKETPSKLNKDGYLDLSKVKIKKKTVKKKKVTKRRKKK